MVNGKTFGIFNISAVKVQIQANSLGINLGILLEKAMLLYY